MLYKEIIHTIERTAPLFLAEDWDRSGVQVASEKQDISRMAVALDPSEETVARAANMDCDFLLCHHPLSLKPGLPAEIDSYHTILKTLLSRGIWLYSAHTSLDANPDGPALWLAQSLGLQEIGTVYPSQEIPAVRIKFYPELPVQALEQLKQDFVLAEERTDTARTGGITIWAVQERAVFSWLQDNYPRHSAITFALRTPVKKFGFGVYGSLEREMSPDFFLRSLGGIMELTNTRFVGDPPERIQKIAYCPGSGADFAPQAFGLGADIYITGDIKYHQAQEIEKLGFALDAGHFILEEEMMHCWYKQLQTELPGLEISFIQGKDPFSARIY
ncbi:MAG: Nif3-like dinuclear metal center hexameric protein [Desulfonatronovibrionaceae bacterium]